MSEEINKIFHRIELDKANDSCGFEFADGFSCTFDNIATCYDDRLKLYELVKQLQKENQQLKEKVEWYEKENKHNQEIIIKDTKVLDEIREYINNLPFKDLIPIEVKIISKILDKVKE